jgi:hypothetical protein
MTRTESAGRMNPQALNGQNQTSFSPPSSSPSMPRAVGSDESKSWFEAMARAWGEALDQQAGTITSISDSLNQGVDTPSQVTLLTAESMKMQFLSNSAATSNNSVGQALETLGKKQ